MHVEQRQPAGWLGLGLCLGVLLVAGAADADSETMGGLDLWVTKPGANGRYGVPQNLGSEINSPHRETTPHLSADGQRLYFASNRPGGVGGVDLYVAELEDGGWGVPQNLGKPVNSITHEFAPCVLAAPHTLIYSRLDPDQAAYDLLVSALVDGTWLEPVAYGEPLHTPGDERMLTVGQAGDFMVYVAARQDTRGPFDLYATTADDHGRFQEPYNLGPTINSEDSDYSPALAPDGRTLYFASTRGGERQFDLYRADWVDGKGWSEPVRLPPPVNSRANEYCPAVGPDGSLYFASDRRQSQQTEPSFEE